MTLMFDYIEYLPEKKSEYLVIWLHGLGASGDDFYPCVPLLGLPLEHQVAFLFPHAPIRPITVNSGVSMRGWYDIRSLSDLRDEDREGLREISDNLIYFIKESCSRLKIATENVVLAGFSQGAATVLYTFLQHQLNLKACIVLSGYLPESAPLDTDFAARGETEILVMHGMYDQVLPFLAGQHAYHQLKGKGFHAKFKSFPYQHEVSMEAFQEIGQFLIEVMDS